MLSKVKLVKLRNYFRISSSVLGSRRKRHSLEANWRQSLQERKRNGRNKANFKGTEGNEDTYGKTV